MPIENGINSFINAAGGTILGLGTQGIANQMQLSQAQALQDMQIEGQKQMGLFNYDQQMKMWKATNYGAQRAEMEKAGLNVGLMYGKGGAGGAIANANPGNVSGQQASSQNNSIAGMGMMLQARQIEAQAKLAEAQARKIESETPTEGNLGDMTLANLKQQGISGMLDNALKAWMTSDPDVRGGNEYDKTLDYHTQIGEGSKAVEQINAALLKTASETNANLANIDLTNQKIKGYWTELLNETKKADAAGIQAAAQKLSAEWNTGEFTNWKTWAEIGMKAVQSVGSLIKGSTNINKTNTYNQQGDRWSE